METLPFKSAVSFLLIQILGNSGDGSTRWVPPPTWETSKEVKTIQYIWILPDYIWPVCPFCENNLKLIVFTDQEWTLGAALWLRLSGSGLSLGP